MISSKSRGSSRGELARASSNQLPSRASRSTSRATQRCHAQPRSRQGGGVSPAGGKHVRTSSADSKVPVGRAAAGCGQRASHDWQQVALRLCGCLACAVLVSAGPAAAERIAGIPRVIDGDTLEVAGTRIRMFGIDAPESKQQCANAKQQQYACGTDSLRVLQQHIGSGQVACDVKNTDQYGRKVAVCYGTKGEDLNEWMVANGAALSYREYSKAYAAVEDQAKAARKGIWGGAFEYPADWRKDQKLQHRQDRFYSVDGGGTPDASLQQKLLPAPKPDTSSKQQSVASTPQQQPPNPECPIKGNINAKGQRIYHKPGSRVYDSTVIDTSRNEQWFCSAHAAEEAGFRAAH